MTPEQKQQIKADFARARQAQMEGKLELAFAIYSHLLDILPEKPEVLYQLGIVATQRENLTQALDFYQRALVQKPDTPEILWGLSGVYKDLDRLDEAQEINDRLIKLLPKSGAARKEKAIVAQHAGDFELAEREFRKAIQMEPLNGTYFRLFAHGVKLKAGDPIIKKMQAALKDPRTREIDRASIAFALAKVREDLGEYDRVFPLLHKGNGILRKAYPYRMDERLREIDTVEACAEGFDFPQTAPPGTFNPVFVTGMPRSGTTLVERILASHSAVTAGGEMTILLPLIFQLQDISGKGRPLMDIPREEWARLGEVFETRLRRRMSLDTPYVTDKSIQTHLTMGQALLAVPTSRFIVVRRDPRDIAVSIYKNFFPAGTHRYSNDLRDIARYIRSFERIVAFWKDKLPGQVHEIQYEDLTADPEGESRKLLEAAGLPWEDQVLEFYKSKGAVKTLSIAQVRQPISRGSVEAWRRYENDLEPFLDEWEKTAP